MIDQQNIVIENIPARDISLLSFYSSVLNITCQQVQLFIVQQLADSKALLVLTTNCASIQNSSYTFFLAEIYTVSGFKEHTLQPQQFFGQEWSTRYVDNAEHMVL